MTSRIDDSFETIRRIESDFQSQEWKLNSKDDLSWLKEHLEAFGDQNRDLGVVFFTRACKQYSKPA